MKNAIKYYYNIEAEDIHQKNNIFLFKANSLEYILYLYDDTMEKIKKIYDLHIHLLQNGLYCHQIILNINNVPSTLIEGKNYVLLKIGITNRKVEYEDILDFSKKYLIYRGDNYVKDWINLWEKKTDYIEYQVNQFSIKYPLIYQSSVYYIGMAETAISYLKNNNLTTPLYAISHKRLKYNSTLIELYNPLNFIVDLAVRDICEYLKASFFEKNINIIEFVKLINLSFQDCIAFLCRMLYPTYYFDAIEDCIDGSKNEKMILKYINKVNEFQNVLSEIMKYYRKNYNIDAIEWLTKT